MILIVYLVWRTAMLLVLTTVGLAALPIMALTGRWPQLLRWYLESAGGGFVKLGQLLATRYDLLPPRLIDELGRLFDRTRPVAFPVIDSTLRRELGPARRSSLTVDP